MTVGDYLNHPLFRVLQRTGTQVWAAYFHNPRSGHAVWGGGDTALAALQMAHQAAVGADDSCGDLF